MSQILGKRRLRLLLAGTIVLAAFWWFGNSMMAGPTSGWKTDFTKSTVDLDDVISGGVPRDGIPPIDIPRFQPVDSVYHLSDRSPVVAINIEGDARAYPLEVLTRHEIVNDVVGDLPIAVTFCPLCNSALVYDRRVDGETLRFGVSGNLLNSDLIMWDDVTESWWQQLTGYAIVGEYSGRRLEFVRSQMISFAVFRERYPLGKVLQGPLALTVATPMPVTTAAPSPSSFAAHLTIGSALPNASWALRSRKYRWPTVSRCCGSVLLSMTQWVTSTSSSSGRRGQSAHWTNPISTRRAMSAWP